MDSLAKKMVLSVVGEHVNRVIGACFHEHPYFTDSVVYCLSLSKLLYKLLWIKASA